ncbi:MAG: tRNA dihydrouridine synthase DusB [Deltaproteobacteria bacterium]|nr:MAG: tRNA dihydrouridine synthase DusB [Deltaproteobacteria bacterium]
MSEISFSNQLESKINLLKSRAKKIKLGEVAFDSNLLVAPMSAICTAPFRVLMEKLGAGGTVSELISCHGINYGNEKTRKMLELHPEEKNIGLQLFGEDPEAMAKAAIVAETYKPKFIDINMGCPVRKVVTKGGGSALMKDTTKLGNFFAQMKKAINIPLTIKIRTGWDAESINAPEIIHIAKEEGVEFVAIHGRTRTQQYQGKADWDLLERIGSDSPLPIIGNGDLHSPVLVRERMLKTNCQALMVGRGCLRNPFIFLEAFIDEGEDIAFTPSEYWEIIQLLKDLTENHTDKERTHLIQMRKHIVWMAAGLPNVAKFRSMVFQTPDLADTMKITEDYFLSLETAQKDINPHETFMAGGHG